MIYVYIYTHTYIAQPRRGMAQRHRFGELWEFHFSLAECRCRFIRVWKKKETGRCLWLEWVYPPKHEKIEYRYLFLGGEPPHLHPLRGGPHAGGHNLCISVDTPSTRKSLQCSPVSVRVFREILRCTAQGSVLRGHRRPPAGLSPRGIARRCFNAASLCLGFRAEEPGSEIMLVCCAC